MKKKIISLMLAICICVFSSIATLAADDSAYSVISPQTSTDGISYGENLLISVKIMEPAELRFTLYSYPNYTEGDALDAVPASVFNVRTQVGASETCSNEEGVDFYTRQMNDIDAGLYGLKIDKIDEEGNTISTNHKYFIAESSEARDSKSIFATPSTSRVMFFQSVFKNLFGTTVVNVSD